MNMDSLELIKFKNEYIKLIEKWGESNELSKYLSHTQPEYLIGSDFEEGISTLFFMIKFNNQIVGAIWLENIKQHGAMIGMYIAHTNYRGKGIGSMAIKTLIDIAFKEIKLKRLYLIVREKNINAIECCKKFGFKITKKYPKAYFLNSSYQSMYQMALINQIIEEDSLNCAVQ